MERILGLDPGFGRVGYGIIEGERTQWSLVSCGCIHTPKDRPLADRLHEIYQDIQTIITTYAPTRAAVEELFFFKNQTTAIGVAQARGVLLLALREQKLPVDEFTPLQVKQAMTGYGRAEKKQVQMMVGQILGFSQGPIQDDAADALAVALACGTALRMSRQA